jgi:Zn-dependent peptidase ImmA (M78 family)
MLHFGMYFLLAAIDLINNLLQVKQRKRYTVAKSLAHVWLQVSDQHIVMKIPSSPPTSAKAKKTWIYTSTSPYAFMA